MQRRIISCRCEYELLNLLDAIHKCSIKDTWSKRISSVYSVSLPLQEQKSSCPFSNFPLTLSYCHFCFIGRVYRLTSRVRLDSHNLVYF